MDENRLSMKLKIFCKTIVLPVLTQINTNTSTNKHNHDGNNANNKSGVVYLCIGQASLAVGVHVKAVEVDVFPCGGSTPVRLLLFQLGQR